jgi:hypothetical protein
MNLRRPTFAEARLALVIGLPMTVLSIFVVRGCSTASVPLLHPTADANTASAPPSTATDDLTGVQLAAVGGTTTLVPTRATGTAHLSGGVNGPQGPVPGAVVRVEHLVDDAPPPTDVLADAAGHWDLPNIAGGRYRVRAFLVPSFAQTQPEIFFLNDGDARNVDLTMEAFAGVTALGAIAPDPPQLNEPATLVVRVVSKTVDTDGIVRAQPIVNAGVVFAAGQGWDVEGSNSVSTDGNGDAAFAVQCRSAGASQVQVQVQPAPNAAPQALTVTVSECVDPRAGAPSTTSASSSSSSSSSGKPSSTTTTAPPSN